MEKLIITCCITGAEVTKEHNPAVPYTPGEISQSTYEAYKAGASIVHLHVREDNGTPTQDKEIYKKNIELIKEKCPDIIIQVSTGGAVWMSAQERIQPVELRPEMASLDCGTCNFGNEVFKNTPETMEYFAKEMKKHGVKPEFEVFERGWIENVKWLSKEGLVDKPLHFDFIMGAPGTMTGDLKDLIYMVESIPAGSTWTVGGIGRYQLPMAVAAIVLGGHTRVGFEDNIYYSKGVLAENNAQLVERITRFSRELGRDIATPDEARKILNLRRA